MKFQLDHGQGSYLIRGHRPGVVLINDEELSSSFIVMPDRLVREWEPGSMQELQDHHLTMIIQLDPEIVILGTGAGIQFPSSRTMRPLIDQGIGYEVMDNAAACRCYAVLMAEGRRVAAAIMLQGQPE